MVYDDIKILTKKSPYFPKAFLELKDCPEVIFVKGNEKILNEFSIAIVGSRKGTFEGMRVCSEISEELTMQGINIVSGLAEGIDTEALATGVRVLSRDDSVSENRFPGHVVCFADPSPQRGSSRGATDEVDTGHPIAILGGGIDKIYPASNKKLALQILSLGGAIISEQFPGEPYLPVHLHNRNRLIAALSKGIVIVEAKSKSGSLITARYAEKLNRKIFAIPGNINDKNYEGSNLLLVEGKHCARNARDILEKYKEFKCVKVVSKKQKDVNLPSTEKLILKSIGKRGSSVDEICMSTKFAVSEVLGKLTVLELSGYVKKAEKKYFRV